MWRSGDISEKFKVQNGRKEVERSSEHFQRAGGKERKAVSVTRGILFFF